MRPYTENLNQCATYWPPGTNDGLGGLLPGEPVPLLCRWQDDAQLFRTPEGREVISKGVVYTSIPVAVGGHLLLGASALREPPPGAEEVRQIGVSPSLDADEALHKAWV